jgi:hypothetical protein
MDCIPTDGTFVVFSLDPVESVAYFDNPDLTSAYARRRNMLHSSKRFALRPCLMVHFMTESDSLGLYKISFALEDS